MESHTQRLYRLLTYGGEGTAPAHPPSSIKCETVYVPVRDGAQLATDIYSPPITPAPVVVMRTPYVRNDDKYVGLFMSFARRGYAVVAQDCRGTHESQPDHWDYYVYESGDGYDCVAWLSEQPWCNGFIVSCGSSYVGQTQWSMATHPAMSAIAPHVSGLGVATNTMGLHLFCNGYARTIGKGAGRLRDVQLTDIETLIQPETMSTGFFNDSLEGVHLARLRERLPGLDRLSLVAAQQSLWHEYCALDCPGRAAFVKQALGAEQIGLMEVESLRGIFGHNVAHDAVSLPAINSAERCRMIGAPALMITGWYDWGLNDALATWQLLRSEGRPALREQHRLIITPHAHNTLGYHEAVESHPELQLIPSIANHSGVLLAWYDLVRSDSVSMWPAVIYYLMGANEWRCASDWPVPEARSVAFYLAPGGRLDREPPHLQTPPDQFDFDPNDPTPTAGGSLVSYLYPVGSVDVSHVQDRADVMVYTSEILTADVDVVGPLRMVLYASSSAVDTDFSARLSDVHPDGRAIQLQNGVLRARYRDVAPELLEPGRVYRFEIDLWATAHRFKAGHQLGVDIASADFPRYDRNSNRGGTAGVPQVARQHIYHCAEYPSHLLVSILEGA